MKNETSPMNCPRQSALQMMKDSISSQDYLDNSKFIDEIKETIKKDSLNSHPILSVLNEGKLSFTELQNIHLEYREAIVQIFTDALTIAVFNTKQLEPRLPPGSKMAARALLTLNCLDEFGFKVGVSKDNYYIGNPMDAHYPLFEQVLKDLHLNLIEISEFQPSESAKKLRSYLESSYSSYSIILALLAVAEAQVITFSPALRKAVKSFGINVSSGYYHVHGVSSDDECNASDDDHEDDMWAAIIQSIEKSDYANVKQAVTTYLDLWNDFWTVQKETIDNK